MYDINGNTLTGGPSNWQGATIVWDGDSLTSGYGLPEFVCNMLGANCVNVAISGLSIGAQGLGSPAYFRRRLANYPATADAIVVHGDINASPTVGTIEDVAEENWFGRWNVYLSQMRAAFPAIPIFLMSTFANYPRKSRTMALRYSQAFHEMCAVYGCIHIDLGTDNQYHMVNDKAYNALSTDGTPNVHQSRELAEKYMYPHIAWKINQYKPLVSSVIDNGITIDQTEVTVTVGNTADLAATITPDRCLYQNNAWTCSNYDVALVSGGQILGVAVGDATVTATTYHGHTVTCTVHVTEAAG